MREKTTTVEEAEPKSTDQYLVDETPEQRPSRRQAIRLSSEEYRTGYDAFGDTRVGIGSAGGDVTKLIRHNEGRHRSDGEHSTREAARDKVRVTQSFCSYLGLPEHQQAEAMAAMDKMNLDRFGHQKRLAKVALATIKVVVEWDRFHRDFEKEPKDMTEGEAPNRIFDDDGDYYRSLLNEHDVSDKDLYSTSQLVKRELKKLNHFGDHNSFD